VREAREAIDGLKSELASSLVRVTQLEAASVESDQMGELANMYSFCIVTILQTSSPSTLLSLLAAISILLLVQVCYAYAFLDWASASFNLLYYPAFLDDLDVSAMYPNSIVDDTFMPKLSYAASTFSLPLLSLLMKNDQEATLLTACPLEHVFLCVPPGGYQVDQPCRTSLQLRIGRLVLCLVLQLFWTMRAVVLPVFAGMGTVNGFIISKIPKEIVLDSVAIAFARGSRSN
jgi:hypothetical protein